MPESDFNVRINTTADTTGARQAQQELGKLNQEAKKQTPVHEDAAKAVSKHAASHRELHVAAHSLVGQFPHLTAILWAFKSPLVAGSLAIGIFIERCLALTESWNKVGEGAGDLASKLTL